MGTVSRISFARFGSAARGGRLQRSKPVWNCQVVEAATVPGSAASDDSGVFEESKVASTGRDGEDTRR